MATSEGTTQPITKQITLEEAHATNEGINSNPNSRNTRYRTFDIQVQKPWNNQVIYTTKMNGSSTIGALKDEIIQNTNNFKRYNKDQLVIRKYYNKEMWNLPPANNQIIACYASDDSTDITLKASSASYSVHMYEEKERAGFEKYFHGIQHDIPTNWRPKGHNVSTTFGGPNKTILELKIHLIEYFFPENISKKQQQRIKSFIAEKYSVVKDRKGTILENDRSMSSYDIIPGMETVLFLSFMKSPAAVIEELKTDPINGGGSWQLCDPDLPGHSVYCIVIRILYVLTVFMYAMYMIVALVAATVSRDVFIAVYLFACIGFLVGILALNGMVYWLNLNEKKSDENEKYYTVCHLCYGQKRMRVSAALICFIIGWWLFIIMFYMLDEIGSYEWYYFGVCVGCITPIYTALYFEIVALCRRFGRRFHNFYKSRYDQMVIMYAVCLGLTAVFFVVDYFDNSNESKYMVTFLIYNIIRLITLVVLVLTGSMVECIVKSNTQAKRLYRTVKLLSMLTLFVSIIVLIVDVAIGGSVNMFGFNFLIELQNILLIVFIYQTFMNVPV